MATSEPHPSAGAARRHRRALLLVMLYATVAALWITVSDALLAWALPAGPLRERIGTVKGWLFVGVTAVLLYGLLYRWADGGDGGEADTLPPPPAGSAPRIVPRWALALLAVTIVGLTALTQAQRYELAQRAVERQLQVSARAKAEQLADWHRERLDDLRLFTQTRPLRDGWTAWRQTPSTDTEATLRHRLTLVLRSGRYRNAGVLDAQGRAIWADGGDATTASPNVRAAVEAALAGVPVATRVWHDGHGWQWLYAAALTDTAETGAVALFIAAPERLAALQASDPAAPYPESVMLARREGEQVWFLDGPTAQGRDPSLPADHPRHPAARLLRGEAPAGVAIAGEDRLSTPVWAVGQPVAGTDWWLLVMLPRAHVLDQALLGAGASLLAALLALFAMIVGALLFDQRARLIQSRARAAELQAVYARLADSEARYRLLAEHGADVVWLYDLAHDRFEYVSPSVQRLLGLPPQALVGRPFDDVLTPAARAHVRQRLPERLAELARGEASAMTETTELVLQHADGRAVVSETVSSLVLDAQGQPVRLQGVTRDLTARREAEAQIRRLTQAIEQSPAAVVITDAEGHIEYVNPAFERISGYRLAQVQGRNPRMLSSGRVPASTWRQAWRLLRDGRPWSGEVINRRPDGSEYLQAVTIAPVLDPHGQITHYVSVQLDISAQRDAEAKAYQLAWFDPLTGLPNRARTLQVIANALQGDRLHRRHRALLLLNIDRFKTFNEALGHASGDALLRQLAQRLQQDLPPVALLARLGGDEFALLTQASTGDVLSASQEAQRLAEAIHAALAAPFDAGDGSDRRVNITVSIGIAVLPHGADESPLNVLRRADTALRRAKEMGGRQSVFFDEAMGATVAQRFAIEQALRRALGAQELRLYLQPQTDATGRWRAAEALVRWQHPTQGLVPPAAFVPVAEDCDLIAPLGAWVLEATCAELGRLARAGCRLPIAVNVSPRQFHRPHFVDEVLTALRRHGAEPADLVLEVTEGVVVDDVDAVVERMRALTSEGVRFSIDDFGTGYSSLSYLRRLPIHEIKIDRSFVQDAPRDAGSAALVEAIIAVAERLRLRVVAEGVETPEHAAYFARWPHVLQQGYLHGLPEPAAAVLARWLADECPGGAANGAR
ncbi:EAL domain-containing protein [Tepidimonas taiwanensis]|uniref:Phytochrome-like protein cph2 n=1 Tax=Tepidimonas taiwanensis TaxID=307486 RepID=A0A554WZ94_9BURK|nr:EAL domain-containing protein [Tepidimonas taiwanensis]MCX7693950.1 EAL domain-containing protein [Tepidimonas taiwanensis]TSE28892.1 Phytochrome-like protein cph2 [Tepidimonas taiwanensis]UBQ05300.1 EAL domain-containing protein [Tepidimonas taiwanensis]